MLYPNAKEISYKYVWNMLSIGDLALPHFWSSLFLSLRSLFADEDIQHVQEEIYKVELMCGTHRVKRPNPETGIEEERLVPVMTLYEIETYLFNSWNLKSYFLVNGQRISQFEIEKKLFEIKQWCYYKMFEIQSQILFTKPPIRL